MTSTSNELNERTRQRIEARHPRPLGGDTARSTRSDAIIPLTGMIIQNNAAPAQLSYGKKPDWLRARMPGGQAYHDLKSLIDEYKLHTVCQEASCPNMGECWSRGEDAMTSSTAWTANDQLTHTVPFSSGEKASVHVKRLFHGQ